MRTQSKKGFTLIELMIVVAIIGVLAVTIVPALTGAQARARDAGRIASLQNITAVLETYFSDEGEYITTKEATVGDKDTGNDYCISDSNGKTANLLAKMFKGGQTPLNPQKTSTSGFCGVKGAYFYLDLTKDGIKQAGYLLISDMESPAKANAVMTGAVIDDFHTDGTTKYEDIKDGTAKIVWGKLDDETSGGTSPVDGAKGSVYGMTN